MRDWPFGFDYLMHPWVRGNHFFLKFGTAWVARLDHLLGLVRLHLLLNLVALQRLQHLGMLGLKALDLLEKALAVLTELRFLLLDLLELLLGPLAL